MTSTTAFYDADCGFCTQVMRRVRRWPLRVDWQPLQSADLAARGIDPARARREMAVAGADGSVHYGHHAWAAILRTGSGPLRAAGRVLDSPVLERPGAAGYAWVADHRGRLPGATDSCTTPGR